MLSVLSGFVSFLPKLQAHLSFFVLLADGWEFNIYFRYGRHYVRIRGSAFTSSCMIVGLGQPINCPN